LSDYLWKLKMLPEKAALPELSFKKDNSFNPGATGQAELTALAGMKAATKCCRCVFIWLGCYSLPVPGRWFASCRLRG